MEQLFVLEKELKNSPKGKVLLLRHKETGERCILREFTGSAETYRKLAALRSPYLPRIQKVEEAAGKVTVVEEYIQGDTLASLLEVKPFTEEQAQKAAICLCRALAVLHAADIVHRDVKPQNVILRGEEAVLIDFDVAREVKTQAAADTQIMGTAGYAAPEQYGFSQTDARADIYAMGVLMNEMLTRQHPSKKLAEGALRPVVEKCIEVNADKRYRDAAELLAALRGAKKRKKKGALAAVFAAVLLLCFVLLLPKEEARPPAEETPHEAVQTEIEKWGGFIGEDGSPIAEPCRFTYDLDGDGAAEEYVFGTSLYNDGLQEVLVISDEVDISGASGAVRIPVPGVWRVTEDGQFSYAAEFAPLLQNAEIKVWRGTNFDAPAPKITAYESAWQGGLRIDYTREHIGIWVYETTATLDGQELRSVSKTVLTSGRK